MTYREPSKTKTSEPAEPAPTSANYCPSVGVNVLDALRARAGVHATTVYYDVCRLRQCTFEAFGEAVEQLVAWKFIYIGKNNRIYLGSGPLKSYKKQKEL